MRPPDPATHHCDVPTIDYSQAAEGRIRCRVDRGGCGRVWTVLEGKGWQPDPRPVGAGRRYDR